jgi:N,N-dimethylformamidase
MVDRLDFENDQLTDHPINPCPYDIELSHHPEWGQSFYDVHPDGSGCYYSTSARPILNLRPDYRMWLQNAPRNLSADLYLNDWLEHEGIDFDVITDHDLHEHGSELLADYDLVYTGSHPEYYSERMLTALDDHLASGGSLLYLGGNGFYWVASQAPGRPHLLEVRRGHGGTRTWEVLPGEGYHSTTGEPGGLWRYRGRTPNSLVGVGTASQGWDKKAAAFKRTPDSFRPEAQFVFAGIGPDELIGDFGLIMNGCSGDEIDRFDPGKGSPENTLVLATSTGHSDFYQLVLEDILAAKPGLGGTTCPLVRSDMTLLERPEGGAVFSVGSICFTGSLSHNDYQNNVSTVLRNVTWNFLSRSGKRNPGNPTP